MHAYEMRNMQVLTLQTMHASVCTSSLFLPYSRLFWRAKLANFNLANTCVPHATPLRTIMARLRVCARMFGGINFGDLIKDSPIRQIKIPAKVSGYLNLKGDDGW